MVTSAPILWITCGSEVTRWRRRPSDASWRRERASQPGTRRTWATLRVTLTPTFSRKIRCYSSGYSVSSSNSSVYSPDITRIILNTQQNMALYFFIYWTEAVRALACLNENWHLWVRISLSLTLSLSLSLSLCVCGASLIRSIAEVQNKRFSLKSWTCFSQCEPSIICKEKAKKAVDFITKGQTKIILSCQKKQLEFSFNISDFDRSGF